MVNIWTNAPSDPDTLNVQAVILIIPMVNIAFYKCNPCSVVHMKQRDFFKGTSVSMNFLK